MRFASDLSDERWKRRTRPHIVIVGAGFGGLTVARKLAKAPVDITLIDRENHHLFQPLLYQVATAGLSPADIAWPIRRLVRSQKNTRVLLGEVTDVDQAGKRVRLSDRYIGYDVLVLATGATHGYFGNDGWAAHAPGLKAIDDATEVRRRLLLAFERAEMERDAARRHRLLTIVIVGGGPTGVEMAGAVAELARKALAADFRDVDPGQAQVVLVEAGPRVLAGFPEHLSDYAADALARLGVDVRLGKAVTACDAEGVALGDERVNAETIVWAAGVKASPAASWLGLDGDQAGRVPVGADLKPVGTQDVFVIGDTALTHDAAGRPLPGIAPVAKQQGTYVADAIKVRVAGRPPPAPFRYRDLGQLATIGRKAAVIAFRRLRLKRWLAWWLWGIAHIYFLISLRNRLIVATQWLWSYVSFERGARLITGPHIYAGRSSTDHGPDLVPPDDERHSA
ncbi:NAD(P)/FAD-dependent oxidoreductase [Algihabitans sp.]|uniref:NAD(P)/FAD-dependent oxidoreductase n=1 Tax=Algihabitans sp. TaxID=2821514 RepID=UPI003BAC47A9